MNIRLSKTLTFTPNFWMVVYAYHYMNWTLYRCAVGHYRQLKSGFREDLTVSVMCRWEGQYLTPASPLLLLLWQFPLQTANVWVQLRLKTVQLWHQRRLNNSMTTRWWHIGNYVLVWFHVSKCNLGLHAISCKWNFDSVKITKHLEIPKTQHNKWR